MDRRDFLRAATATVATGCLLDIGTATADPHRLWREYLAAPDRHPRIPNVSYAGYRLGEHRLPRPPVRAAVTGFGAVGDGVTDCTAAFNAAVEAVGARGGGTVFVPPGEYLLSSVVWVHHSGVVLRGAGRNGPHSGSSSRSPPATARRPATSGRGAAGSSGSCSRGLIVTVRVSLAVVVLSVIVGVPTAYALARRNFPGKRLVTVLFLLPILLPPMTYGIPLATVLYKFDLAGGIAGVVIANLVPSVPFVVLTMTPFIEQIDPKIEAAARMCGS